MNAQNIVFFCLLAVCLCFTGGRIFLSEFKVAEYHVSFFLLFSLSADEYKVFLEQREEKLKADAAAAAAAAAEASGKKK